MCRTCKLELHGDKHEICGFRDTENYIDKSAENIILRRFLKLRVTYREGTIARIGGGPAGNGVFEHVAALGAGWWPCAAEGKYRSVAGEGANKMSHNGEGVGSAPSHADAPNNWEELRAAVTRHYGVYRLSMERLRGIGGYGRLGTNVRQVLSAKLASLGLGHLPAELPAYQDKHLLLYLYGTPAAEVISALRSEVVDAAETALVQLNASRDGERVREASLKAAELLSILSDRCRGCIGPLDR